MEDMPVTFELCAAFVWVVGVSVFANIYLFRLYRSSPQGTAAGALARWAAGWEFSPQSLGGFSWRQLVLASLLALFLELLMIRWISSEIRIFAYLKNFVLIACFLGFGLGCYLSRRRINLLPMVVPLLALALLVQLPWKGLRLFISELPAFLGATSEVHIWSVPTLPMDAFSLLIFVAAVAVIVPIFGLLSLLFIPIGQLVAWYLENSGKGILGYSVNILASLSGIILYTLLCFLNHPPAVWYLLAGGVLIGLLWKVPRLRWSVAAAYLLCVVLMSLGPGDDSAVFWSPYQKLTLIQREEAGKTVGYVLKTNDSWYQQILDLSAGFVSSHPQFFEKVPIEWNAYNLPYRFFPQPPSVLVLGSGMGNDVAAALRNGAGRVTAVEIDPLILKLGEKLHFERPYSSPRVRRVLDDARSYIQNTEDRFDLIVFSLLDSHTTSSHFSNIRIDNYVYTLEALRMTKRLLQADGMLIIKFQVDTSWIAGRLYGLLENVFGRPPLQIQADRSPHTTAGRFFIAGFESRIAQALSHPQLAAYVAGHKEFKMEPATLTTDDWPYFYQQRPGLPTSVIVVSVVLVVLCWLLMRRTGTAVRSLRWHFFFLGAGFLLLEAQIISKMALLFGTTWVVNSIVIAGLLLLILAANLLVQTYRTIPLGSAYAGIFAFLLGTYWIPLERLFFSSVWLKALTATLVLCLPVLFAGIVFIRSFEREGFRGEALGSNLLGALCGGIMESLSLWTGLRSLLILAALFYLASWVVLQLERPLAEATLEPALSRAEGLAGSGPEG